MEPEELWEHLLSEKSALIRRAWQSMDERERDAVRRHLQTMAREAGWHPSQSRAVSRSETPKNIRSKLRVFLIPRKRDKPRIPQRVFAFPDCPPCRQPGEGNQGSSGRPT